jgi:vacuolar iron transporter family protein
MKDTSGRSWRGDARRRVAAARRAKTTEHQHTHKAIRERLAAGPRQSYLRDWVYGGIDGAVTTFAIVSGVVGAQLAPAIILILGIANLIADGLAMAASNYLATRAEHEEFRYSQAVEHRHIKNFPDGEREEVREIFRRHGLQGDLLEHVVAAITADRDRWVQTMLREEYGLPSVVRSTLHAAASTFSAFLLCGLVPLAPFVARLPSAFPVAAVATGLVFVVIGAAKSTWSIHSWWHSGFETLAVGGSAATVAYAIGAWLRGLVG